MSLPTLGRFVIPEVVASHFHIHEGDRVADFGAGSGYFIPTLSKAVGPEGRVYACEIQKVLVEKLGAMVRKDGYGNVEVLWCDLEHPNGIKLQTGVLDAGILVNTFFQFEDKENGAIELRRVIRTGGVLHVIDWSESFGGLGPLSEQIVTKAQTCDYFEAHGFMLEREYPAGDHHYGVSFRAI
jgi:ubiquinone/menaquinone biosynthesis C-methylase UbiE